VIFAPDWTTAACVPPVGTGMGGSVGSVGVGNGGSAGNGD
jgi:hypothetical protein